MADHTPRLLDALDVFEDGIYIINDDYTVEYMNKFLFWIYLRKPYVHFSPDLILASLDHKTRQLSSEYDTICLISFFWFLYNLPFLFDKNIYRMQDYLLENLFYNVPRPCFYQPAWKLIYPEYCIFLN